MSLIKEKVGEFSIGEAFAIGVSKAITEQALKPLVGNGNYKSGAIKLALAWAVPKYALKGEMGKIIGTGLAVDGVEDIVNQAIADFIAPMQSNTQGAII